ncbi:hypothetical protein like AT1G07175 [Hibiscus trionum]|uniref:Glycine-rich protein n=1 Tax=Hibiscus trionum TaxID=183268 RepID=A0A9W7HV00_HIBTR|nr:hypothetical protein like AT1G07175 [Hibiscus trionum]
MGFEVKLCFFLLFTLAVFSSARNTISISGDEISSVVEGRFLASIEDYNEPSANRGHDPPSRTGARGGGGNGRGHRRGRKG